jgi:hypothetical protein
MGKVARFWPAVGGVVVAGLLLPSGTYGPALICVGVGLAISLVLQIVHDQTVDRWLALHDNGLVHADKTGVVTLTWPDIASVQRMDVRHYRNGVYTGTTHKTVINPTARAAITLNDRFREIEAVSEHIVTEVTAARLPLVVDAVNGGQSVPFGAFSVQLQGIGHKDQYLSWERVDRIIVNQGFLRITEKGQRKPWAKGKAVGMPNFPIFLYLAQAFGATIG